MAEPQTRWWQATRTARPAFWLGGLSLGLALMSWVFIFIDVAETRWYQWPQAGIFTLQAVVYLYSGYWLRRQEIEDAVAGYLRPGLRISLARDG